MAQRGRSEAARQVEIAIAVQVLDDRTLGARPDDRPGSGSRRSVRAPDRRTLGLAKASRRRAGLRPRRRDADLGQLVAAERRPAAHRRVSTHVTPARISTAPAMKPGVNSSRKTNHERRPVRIGWVLAVIATFEASMFLSA